MDTTGASTTEIARLLYARLLALDIKQAEEAIEDARKIMWVSTFSGASRSAASELYARTPIAAVLAADLEGRSLLEVEAILQELRFALYVNAYGAMPETRFGSLMSAAVDRADHEANGRSSH